MESHKKLLVKSFNLSEIWHSSNIRWNPKTCQLLVLENTSAHKNRIRFYYFCLLLLVLGGVFRFHSNDNFQKPSTEFMLFGTSIVYHFCFYIFFLVVNRSDSLICLYVNGILNIRQQYSYRANHVSLYSKSLISYGSLLFAYGLFIVIKVFPLLFVYGVHWNLFPQASLAGYFFAHATNCMPALPISLLTVLKWFTKTLILVVNHWHWCFGISTSGITLIVLMVLSTVSLVRGLQW